MPGPAVLAFGEVLGVPLLESAEVFIDLDAFLEVEGHLVALRDLVGALDSVVVEALGEGALVGEAGELVVGLRGGGGTLYYSNWKGTSLHRLRWFSGRSRRCMAWRGT